jgi:hypothetical protein
MAFSKELLDHAILLSGIDRPGERKQVNLRRAVSAAYYSLFHLLTMEALKIGATSGSAIDLPAYSITAA